MYNIAPHWIWAGFSLLLVVNIVPLYYLIRINENAFRHIRRGVVMSPLWIGFVCLVIGVGDLATLAPPAVLAALVTALIVYRLIPRRFGPK
jgi:hypothetical protein